VSARLEELRKAIREHPGTQAHTLWARLRRTHRILAANLREFDKLINGPEGDWELALDLITNTGAKDDVQDAFYNEFDRLLHNVVAAIGTLIDHTRIVAKRYEATPFYDEYSRRVAEVGKLPAAKFVKELRNYMLHQSLPAPYSQVNLSPQQVTYQLHVSVPSLLESSSWSPASRTYLARYGDELPIRKPFDEYTASIDGLYEWMFAQSAMLDVAETTAANRLIDEYNDVLTGRRRGGASQIDERVPHIPDSAGDDRQVGGRR
jgi:hypothetical protein